jgi:hypothetical protein
MRSSRLAPRPDAREPLAPSKGATDRKLPGSRSRGRCVAALYNHVRPHSSLGNRTPAQARRAFEQDETITPDALVQAQEASYLTVGLSL